MHLLTKHIGLVVREVDSQVFDEFSWPKAKQSTTKRKVN